MITLADIREATQMVSPYIKRTPLERSSSLSQELGTNVYLKYELFQKTGSFKPRGAFNQILHLSEAQRARGVVAVSGGNFAQGVAYAGRVLGVRTLICMPSYTPANYVTATKAYGGDVAFKDTMNEVFDLARQYQEQGWAGVHPFDSPHQMAGCGTIGLEILEDLPEVTDVFVSVGGGGLIAGIIVALKALKPDVRVWAVETEGSETLGQALQAGKVVQITPHSLARTLGSPYIAADALALCQQHLAGYQCVSDREAFEALLFLLERAKIITELAAACTLAAARQLKTRFSGGEQVVLLMCGGNTSLENLNEYQAKLLNNP